MSTPSQIAANRTNAKASTGPRTRGGKHISSQNARRHGLGVAITEDGEWSQLIRALAAMIAAGESDPRISKLAVRVAEAQLEVLRARNARYLLLSGNCDGPICGHDEFYKIAKQAVNACASLMSKSNPNPVLPDEVELLCRSVLEWNPEGVRKFFYRCDDFSRELSVLDRYERRALSKRKFAIRDFDAVVRAKSHTN